jgi:hypothetical protein
MVLLQGRALSLGQHHPASTLGEDPVRCLGEPCREPKKMLNAADLGLRCPGGFGSTDHLR